MSLPALAAALLLSPADQPPPLLLPRSNAAREEQKAPELSDPLADPATTPALTAPTSRPRHAPGDPFQRFNRYWFNRQQSFDRHLLRPVALGYTHAVPKPARSGLRNFFRNLGEPLVFLNYLLQLKPGKAAETAGRFLVNTGLGLGGFLDVAKQPKVNLPHRPNGLGDTLGYYGVGPGPYLFLPLLGPTTLRDFLGGQAEAVIVPATVGGPFVDPAYQVPRGVLTGLDARAEADEDLNALLRDAVDPYATFRSAFLQDRAGEIAQLHGRPKAQAGSELGDPLADPAGASAAAASAPSAAPELADPLADPAGSAAAPTVTGAPDTGGTSSSPAKAGASSGQSGPSSAAPAPDRP